MGDMMDGAYHALRVAVQDTYLLFRGQVEIETGIEIGTAVGWFHRLRRAFGRA